MITSIHWPATVLLLVELARAPGSISIGRTYANPGENGPPDGLAIGVLAAVVAVALVASVVWALVFGGIAPPAGQFGLAG
jgi:hypothetical protein